MWARLRELQAHTKAQVTQPSPCTFQHICRVLEVYFLPTLCVPYEAPINICTVGNSQGGRPPQINSTTSFITPRESWESLQRLEILPDILAIPCCNSLCSYLLCNMFVYKFPSRHFASNKGNAEVRKT